MDAKTLQIISSNEPLGKQKLYGLHKDSVP